MAVSTPAAIELDHVTKVYKGNVRALDDVTLRVEESELCCLLGPNGAGKTTIIKLLEGALTPNGGAIFIRGSLAHGKALLHAKREVGVVPQSPGLYPDLTVLEYLRFVSRLYGRGDVISTARSCGLEEYVGRPLATLSGGLQRRLLVASAILPEPSLLLLDEPTVGLDPLAAHETRALLRQIVRGRSVLMSTHNLAEAEELCDTVIILRRGHVLVHEKIDDLRRQAVPHVHLAARQGMEVLGRALDGLGVPWLPNVSTAQISMEEPERAAPMLLRTLLENGVDVYECRVVPPTLEDLFVDVITRR